MEEVTVRAPSVYGIRGLWLLSRDFLRYMRGNDYFHNLQGLGHYFQDERCYYNDLTKKADWTGERLGGLPVARLAASGEPIALPTTVLLYGLGSIDKYFLESRPEYLECVQPVCRWLFANLLPQGYFDNHCKELYSHKELYSNNCAMTQGLTLSFALRVIRYKLADGADCNRLDNLVEAVRSNLMAPVEQEGTALRTDEGLFLMEICWRPHNIVLNGWIFAIFGLIDYLNYRHNPQVEGFLIETLATMKAVLPRYCLPNGWSRYDSDGRLASPFYHALHIAMLDALYRLTAEDVFGEYMEIFRRGNHFINRTRYTLVKIQDKLTDIGPRLRQT
jgi:hypothetical protein